MIIFICFSILYSWYLNKKCTKTYLIFTADRIYLIIQPITNWIFWLIGVFYGESIYIFKVIGMLIGCLSFALIIVVMDANPFFCRYITTFNNHSIISKGPYRIIRHPGYLAHIGMVSSGILFGICFPVIIIGIFQIAIIIIRMFYEDNKLRSILPGYKVYCSTTNYLIPKVF